MGAVIDENAANRLGTAIDQAKNRSGHKLLVGGSVDTERGWFVEPTVIVAEDPDSALMQKEFLVRCSRCTFTTTPTGRAC